MKKALILLLAAFTLVKIGLTVARPPDVEVAQAKLFEVQKGSLTPLPALLFRGVGRVMGTGTRTAIVVQLGLYFLLAGSGYLWLKDKVSSGREWLPVVLLTNLWIQALAMFYWPESLTVASVWLFLGDRHPWRRILWVGLIALTTIPGLMIAAGIIIGQMVTEVKMRRKTALVWILAGLILAGWSRYHRMQIKQSLVDGLWAQLTSDRLAQEVDLSQKTIWLASGKTFMYPPVLRKIVFNKAVFGANKIAATAISWLDPTQWTAPWSAWAITGLSGLPPKGVLPIMHYWELPLLMAGMWVLVKNRKREVMWLLLPITAAFFWEKKFWQVRGIGMIPVMIWAITQGVGMVPGKWKWGILGLYTLAGGYYLRLLYFQPQTFRYPDTYLYKKINNWTSRNAGDYQKTIVTTMFGPTEMMNNFYGSPGARVEYRNFDLNKQAPEPGVAYIGLPGQFVPPDKNIGPMTQFKNRPVEVIPAQDELVYNYGKGLWILK